MKKDNKIITTIIILLLIPVAGFGVMRWTHLFVPLSEGNTTTYILYTVILIALGLLIPYGIMKLLFHSAHIKNPNEKELYMADLPKDKDDAEQALKRQ
jgi:uncharacterized membrane protein YidH (DUF202 family)